MNMKKWAALGIAVLTAATLIAGCGNQSDVAKDPKQADGVKVLKVGTNATFVPFEFKNDQSQELEGFDIDVVNAVAKRMNVHVEFKNVPFDALVPALDNGEIDLAASGMTITKARAEKVGFSSPYYESGMAVLVKDDSNINDLAALNGKTVAVQMGTTGADLAAKIDGANVKSFNHTNEALLELKNGAVNAALIDLPVAQYYVNVHPEDHMKLIAYPNTKEYFGLAMNKKNEDLVKAVNQALLDMKKDGELGKIYKKWFKVDMPDIPVVYEPTR